MQLSSLSSLLFFAVIESAIAQSDFKSKLDQDFQKLFPGKSPTDVPITQKVPSEKSLKDPANPVGLDILRKAPGNAREPGFLDTSGLKTYELRFDVRRVGNRIVAVASKDRKQTFTNVGPATGFPTHIKLHLKGGNSYDCDLTGLDVWIASPPNEFVLIKDNLAVVGYGSSPASLETVRFLAAGDYFLTCVSADVEFLSVFDKEKKFAGAVDPKTAISGRWVQW